MKPFIRSHAMLFLALAFLFFHQKMTGQTITYQLPDDFYACGIAQYEVTVSNNTGSALLGLELTYDFSTSSGTDCGVAYLAGSVIGATEANVSNLGMPVFGLGDLAAGGNYMFIFEAEAPCAVAGCIDAAEVFLDEITLNWNGGSSSINTAPYAIERALLVITDVEESLLSGSQGDVLERKTTIVNSRPGALQGFIFSDNHQGGIEITSDLGTVFTSTSTAFQIALGGDDFATIGDGDELFELNETICITESILVTDCGVDIPSTVSTITVGWGCGGEICQEVSANAIVTIDESIREPSLFFEPITSLSECFCGPDGYEQGLKISNFGDGPALDLVVDILKLSPDPTYLYDSVSVRVDSAGVLLPILPSMPNTVGFSSPCDAPESLVNGFTYTFPQLGLGESMTVYFDVYFCNTLCPSPRVEWWYDYSYFKPCPPDPFVENEDPIYVSDIGNLMSTSLSIDPNPPVEDDAIYLVSYELEYDSLTLLDDTLVLQLELPCGLIWVNDNDLIIDGQSPIDFEVEMVGDFTVVTANYLLPFSSNMVETDFEFIFDCESLCMDEQICQDSLETTCMGLDTCDIVLPQSVILPITTTIRKCPDYPLSCNLQECAQLLLEHECPLDSVCIEQPPGYVTYGFDAKRKNYGLADDDNDRLPDGTGGANLSLVERHRLLTGDTIRAEVRGEIVVDIPGSTLPYGNLSFNFGATELSVGNYVALTQDGSGIQQAGVLIRVYDNSAGAYFDCPNPDAIIDEAGRLVYTYDISAAALGSCLPADFEYADGDSIIAIANYRIEHNLISDPDFNPLLAQLTIGPEIYVFDQDTSLYDPLGCGCEKQTFELSGYRYSILPGQFALPGCAPSEYVTGSVFSIIIHEDNFFPFEYRNLVTALDWEVSIPPAVGVEMLEARLGFLNYQNGSPILNNIPLTWTGNNPYDFDLLPFQDPPLDEGFVMLFQYIFDAECDIFGSNPIELATTLDFDDGLPEDDPLDFSIESNSLRGLVPNLSANAILCDIISFNNQLVFDFSFANFPTLVANQSSGAAPNTWMYVSSPSGLVTDFQLFDSATGMEIPQTNGVFQLGDFPIDTIELQLVALNNSCETEPLELHYGWNCDPFTSQVQTPCYEQVKPLSILSPPGEIDFLLESPTGCFDLCDTVDYHTLNIFNAELGAVYGLTVSGLLPPGLTVLPGSSEVEYPTGSGQFFAIGDPTMQPGGVVNWPLAELFDSLEMGLPGISFAPQNAITLRFLSATSCDFVAEAFSLFAITADQVCGVPTNTVAKAGDPICVNGVSAPYSTNINFETTPGFGCVEILEHEVSISATEDLPAGATVTVFLPPGILYQPGTCVDICGTGMDCTPGFTGNAVIWNLPEGVEAGQLICFGFATSGWSDLECGDGQILVRTANETQAFCAATGMDCSTNVQTGALLESFSIEKPEFELDNFEISASQNGANDVIDFSIDVTNQSVAPNEPPIVLDFYLDTDGDGSGDDLVHTENVVETLASGQFETVTGSFEIPSGNLCNLVAYIDPANQCACALDSAYVTVAITYQTEQTPTVCSGEEVEIGVDEMPGFTYQWEPADCLFDELSATTIFNCVNDEGLPVTYSFILSETDGDICEINNLIEVTVQPVPGIAFTDSPICQGQAANIAATPGVTYQWNGPGVVQNVQVQTVMPSVTTTYSVTVTDDFGCSGEESVDIIVNPLPPVDAGPDIQVCPGQTAQLNAPNVTGLDYLWSPAIISGAPALDNPSIPNPVVLTNQTTSFTLEVTDQNGCSATDIAVVDFNGNIDLIMPADLTICLGSSATLIASGADNYVWSPSGTCLDPPACSTIEVMPTVTTTYTVDATTTDGCTDSGEVTVTVSDSEILVPLTDLEICADETVVIFGEEVNTPGIYFDTVMVAGSDCDTIFSQNLFVFPPIDTTLFSDTICAGETVLFEGMEVGESTCVVYSSPNGCDSTVCLDLSVLPVPDFELIIEPDTSNAPGTEITLSIEPSNFDSIVWMGGGIGEECVNLPTCTDILGETDTLYTATVFDGSCENTVSQLVTAIIECEPSAAVIPNVFTPNGDQLNDTFSIVSPNAEEVVRMEIWNRWGEKVYDGKGPWDGTQDGEPAGSDVYIYLIEVGCPVQVTDAEEEVLKGDVTLLR